MAKKRITIDIGSDVKKMGKLLRAVNDDREILRRLVKGNLARELARAKINLDDYQSDNFSINDIVDEIKGMLVNILNQGFPRTF